MVDIIKNATNRTLSLEEYSAYVRDNVDMSDIESLRETAWALRALANDRSFLLNRYHAVLERLAAGDGLEVYTPQSLVLESGDDFYVRANIWMPVDRNSVHFDTKIKSNAYDLPHDHSFDFVSVGYFGAGYVTDIYQYDGQVEGCIGEAVSITPQGRYALSAGDIFVYEANRDIHVQYPPKEVSVSLNLMQTSEISYARSQYVFDLEAGRIANAVTDQVASRIFLLDVFEEIHDDNSIELLLDVVRNYPCAKARARALRILLRIRPSESNHFMMAADAEARRMHALSFASAGTARKKESA